MVTFTVFQQKEKGVIHAHGKGVVMTTGVVARGDGNSGRTEPEMITYTGEGIRRVDSLGKVKWYGSLSFRRSSGSKLAFVNNMVGVFETDIDDDDGNLS